MAGARKVTDLANYVMRRCPARSDAEHAGRGRRLSPLRGVSRPGMAAKTKALAPEPDRQHLAVGRHRKTIIETITNGRANQMPAWKDFLGDGRCNLLTAYVGVCPTTRPLLSNR